MILNDNIMRYEIKKILKQANIKVNQKNLDTVKDIIVNNYNVEKFTKEIYETIEYSSQTKELTEKNEGLKYFVLFDSIYIA